MKTPQAQVYEEESLVLSQELGYGKGEADALLVLGRIALWWWQDQNAAKPVSGKSSRLLPRTRRL